MSVLRNFLLFFFLAFNLRQTTLSINCLRMPGKFTFTEDNKLVVETIFNLISSKENDESCFRRCFTLANIISGDYTLITRPDKPSVYGYFVEKVKKKALKIGPEIDETVLEAKLSSADLAYGEDFFSRAEDYIHFANKYLVARSDELDSDDEGNLEPVDLVEEDENLKEKENAKEPPPPPPTKLPPQKKQRLPKIIPTVLSAEDKKFCIFHTVPDIPLVVQSIPDQYDFTAKELADLAVPCNGLALHGVVTPNHPLYGVPLVCDRHKARKYFHIYWRQRCSEGFVFTKLPNFARLCSQGKGGRPQVEEGKVLSNAASLKRFREKKEKKATDLLTSYAQVLEEKTQLSMFLNNQQFLNEALQGDYEQLQQQYQNLYAQMHTLAGQKESLLALVCEKDKVIQDLQEEVEQLRAQVHLGL